MRLKNTSEDNQWLKEALEKNKTVKAKITYGVFTSKLASSLVQITLIGDIYSLENSYINWKYNNEKMIPVSINCVEII